MEGAACLIVDTAQLLEVADHAARYSVKRYRLPSDAMEDAFHDAIVAILSAKEKDGIINRESWLFTVAHWTIKNKWIRSNSYRMKLRWAPPGIIFHSLNYYDKF